MKKSHFLLLSLVTTFAFWILDALANTSLYQTSLVDELFLVSPHTHPFLKITIAVLIFSFGYTLSYLALKEPPPPCIKEIDALQKISEILFAPFSEKVNIAKSLEKLEELLSLEATLLLVYHRDMMTIYNENFFIKTLFRTKEIYPFRTNSAPSEAEKIAINCFLEKREFSQDTLIIDKIQYTVLSVMIKEEKSEKPLANLMLITKNEPFVTEHLPMIEKATRMLSFVLSLSAKREHLLEMDTKHTMEHSLYDTTLNIMNFTKFQEYIEAEYKRAKRYQTETTLVLLEIRTLKNLVNVFEPEVIVNLKKDFVALIKKHIREVDVFGKWNNEQFALLLPQVDFRAGQGVAKKIQVLLDEHKFNKIGKINCNFGITSLSQKDTIGTLRLRCESALVLASTKEGNAIEVKLLV